MELYPVNCALGRPLVITARSMPNAAPPSRAKFRRQARGDGCGQVAGVELTPCAFTWEKEMAWVALEGGGT
eukprot:10485014-Alexandrium_andersonii.AAC.1